ncbi:hypothetical protein PghCCS26_47260 [Paenibacillus glycanilyticus]|uniref:Uncharacterized protein n=1 Tax=Paenibacillus glycanilyticus TaxID=126569 RepID=A0ABQ6NR90_9BACL|nr:hypothetical protein [Paenibacillus glycanilyticus]GMK47596.1 hypothetical protein PghCCS26_47260 [Paenibacillus glycanilyticus]
MNNNSKVTSFIEKKIREMEENTKRSKGKERRFTVVLSEYDFKRLTFITGMLSEPKSALAREFIVGALDDAELALKLTGWEKADLDELYLMDEFLSEEEKIESRKQDYRLFMEKSIDSLDETD